MKIYLEKLEEIETHGLLKERARFSKDHVLVESPELADLIIVTGHFGRSPEMLLDNPSFLRFADKCATYDEFDHFVPLIPGVYCNALISRDSKIGRVFSFAHVSRNGVFPNPHVQYRPHLARKFLFSFQGGSTSIVRKRLFRLEWKRDDVVIENTSSYGHWEPNPGEGHEQRQKLYV
jgi:hypothetical protein